jgi:SAM-dependent methyltransferase
VLGAGNMRIEGAVHHDLVDLPGIDVCYDLNDVPWRPWTDGQFSRVWASHVLEHLPETLAMMDQIYRILDEDGIAIIEVPHYQSEGAFVDPTHCSFFTPHTMDYCVEGTQLSQYAPYYVKRKFAQHKVELYDGVFGKNIRFTLQRKRLQPGVEMVEHVPLQRLDP